MSGFEGLWNRDNERSPRLWGRAPFVAVPDGRWGFTRALTRSTIGAMADDNVIAFPAVLDGPDLHPDDARALAALLSPGPAGFDIEVDARYVAGLLSKCRNRAGGESYAVVARGLLRGLSRSMAVAGSGISYRTLNDQCLRDPEIADVLKECEQVGFSLIHEREMYRRAHAGAEDRGSVRMLEVIAKARDPQYREKYQVEHEHIVRAEERTARVLGGWQAERVDDGYDE